MAEVTGVAGQFELDKRFYIPGKFIKDNCPQCGKEWVMDMAEHYLSYPEANAIKEVSFYCWEEGCEYTWTVQVKVIVDLELVKDEG